MIPDRNLTREQVASATGMDPATLDALVARGDFPEPTVLPNLGKTWLESEVLAWLEPDAGVAHG